MGKKVICFGEVLWDLLPQGAQIGGAPLNVCYHLNQLGIDSKIISQVGNDELGRALLDGIQKLGIDSSYCSITEDHPTSSVTVDLDNHGKATYTIVENVAWDFIPFKESIADQIKESDVFIFGSLVIRNQCSLDTLKSYLVSAKYVVMDINLRDPFYQKDLILDILKSVNCLKINDDELELLGKWMSITSSIEGDYVKAILDSYPEMKDVILTKGELGASYFSRNETYSVKAYKVNVVDTVGAGDSFLAAFLASRISGKSIIESLESASVLSAYVASQIGACPYYAIEDIVLFKENYTTNS